MKLATSFPDSWDCFVVPPRNDEHKTSKKIKNSIVLKLQKKLGNLTANDLQFHRLFDRTEIYQNAINNIKFDSKDKTTAFRKILLAKLEADIMQSRAFYILSRIKDANMENARQKAIQERNDIFARIK